MQLCQRPQAIEPGLDIVIDHDRAGKFGAAMDDAVADAGKPCRIDPFLGEASKEGFERLRSGACDHVLEPQDRMIVATVEQSEFECR
jgi:hypothetical protein